MKTQTMKRLVRELSGSLLSLLYPRLCVGCGSDLIMSAGVLCLDCLESLPVTNFHLHPGNPVERLFNGRLPVASASSYLYFNKGSSVQRVLHELKYRGNRDAGIFFGRKIGHALREHPAYNDVDALIPLPLHRRRERQRGYNQATVLCTGMSQAMNVPVVDKAITRTSETDTQTKKSRSERWKNMAGKFQVVDAAALANKHLLLVDDVLTTGATLEACGSVLLEVPGVKLGIVTLAYTSL